MRNPWFCVSEGTEAFQAFRKEFSRGRAINDFVITPDHPDVFTHATKPAALVRRKGAVHEEFLEFKKHFDRERPSQPLAQPPHRCKVIEHHPLGLGGGRAGTPEEFDGFTTGCGGTFDQGRFSGFNHQSANAEAGSALIIRQHACPGAECGRAASARRAVDAV